MAPPMEMPISRYDDLNWRRNGPTQVVCVEPAYDGSEAFGVLSTDVEALVDSQEWVDDEEGVEWALD